MTCTLTKAVCRANVVAKERTGIKVILSCCVVLLVVLAGLPAQALESLVLYDDFNAKLIDPDKWYAPDFALDYSQVFGGVLEATREIQGGRLRVLNRAYGDRDSDTGTRFGFNRLVFSNPENVTAIQVTVEVKKFEAAGCATSGSSTTYAGARIGGFFFNTGTPIPYDATNDVWAAILIYRASSSSDPSNVLRTYVYLYHCADSLCSTGTTLTYDDLGTMIKGQPVTLRIQWDPDNDRFIFQRDDEPEVFLSYTVSDTAPAGLPLKPLEVAHWVAKCTAEPPPVAFMEAFFDDVFVNESGALQSVTRPRSRRVSDNPVGP